jgi:hypothetical protein
MSYVPHGPGESAKAPTGVRKLTGSEYVLLEKKFALFVPVAESTLLGAKLLCVGYSQ